MDDQRATVPRIEKVYIYCFVFTTPSKPLLITILRLKIRASKFTPIHSAILYMGRQSGPTCCMHDFYMYCYKEYVRNTRLKLVIIQINRSRNSALSVHNNSHFFQWVALWSSGCPSNIFFINQWAKDLQLEILYIIICHVTLSMAMYKRFWKMM